MSAEMATLDSRAFLYFNDPDMWCWFPFRDDDRLHAVEQARLVVPGKDEADPSRSVFRSLCKLQANSNVLDLYAGEIRDRCEECVRIAKAGKETQAERLYDRFMSKANNRSLMRRLANSNKKVTDS